MWLGTKLTALSDYLFKTFFRLLFRYDIFISYARRDGKDYALRLRDQLKQLDFSCFLDLDELPPGNSLNHTLRRALRRSATLVIVGTEGALRSRFVELEVGEFAPTGRAVIPIDIEGSLADAPWEVVRARDLVRIDEVRAALEKGVPSANVADQIDKLFKYTRRNSRVRAQVLATMGLFVLVVAGSLLLIRQQVSAATTAAAEAERQKADAQTQRRAADAATADARAQKASADEATRRAEQAQHDAERALDKAERAEHAAGEAAAEARRQENAALTSAALARAEQSRAEERTRYVQAQQTGVQALLALNYQTGLEKGVLLSVESLKRSLTPEGYIAWASGVSLLPRATEAPHAYAPGPASAIAYSPDGRWFAQGSRGVVELFPSDRRGEPRAMQLSPATEVESIAFVHEGAWLAAASKTEVRLWDLSTFEPVGSLSVGGESVAFSPDGRSVAISSRFEGGQLGFEDGRRVRVLDTRSGAQLVALEVNDAGYVTDIAFSPNGRWLVASYIEGRVVGWEVKDFAGGAGAVGNPRLILNEGGDYIERVAFSPRGDYFVVGSRAKGSGSELDLRWWRLSDADGALRLSSERGVESAISLSVRGRHNSLSFSPDEMYLASGVDGETARVWNVITGYQLSELNVREWAPLEWSAVNEPAPPVAFSADGRLLATAGVGLKFWKTEFDAGIVHLPHPGGVEALAISPRGEWLATVGEGGLRVFRTSDWSTFAARAEVSSARIMKFSPDGRWLYTFGEGGLTVLETSNWKVSMVIDDLTEPLEIGSSTDGHWLIIKTTRETRLFTQGTWREARLRAGLIVEELLFTPDGRWAFGRGRYMAPNSPLASIFVLDASADQPVTCEISVTSEPVSEPQSAAVNMCSDLLNRLAAATKQGEWVRTQTLIEITQPQRGSGSPDGRWGVRDDRNGLKLTLQQEIGAQVVAELSANGFAMSAAFTSDGRWVAVAGYRTVALWPLKPADMIAEACRRLRRRDLTPEEWRRYFLEPKAEQTCPR